MHGWRPAGAAPRHSLALSLSGSALCSTSDASLTLRSTSTFATSCSMRRRHRARAASQHQRMSVCLSASHPKSVAPSVGRSASRFVGQLADRWSVYCRSGSCMWPEAYTLPNCARAHDDDAARPGAAAFSPEDRPVPHRAVPGFRTAPATATHCIRPSIVLSVGVQGVHRVWVWRRRRWHASSSPPWLHGHRVGGRCAQPILCNVGF